MGTERFLAMLTSRSRTGAATLLTPELAVQLERDGDAGELELPEAFAAWHPFDRLQYLDLKLRLVDFVNHGLDRATMAYSVEARLPLLDHHVLELCCAMPRRLRMRRLAEKYALRRAMRGLVPDQIRTRAKRGTRSPIEGWLRGGWLPECLREPLSDERIASAGYFRRDRVRALLARQRAGEAALAHELLSIAAVQLWHDQFVAGRGAPERPRLEDLDGATAPAPPAAAAV
jgi:asparagine synthase (glutamine-hydrolysing)